MVMAGKQKYTEQQIEEHIKDFVRVQRIAKRIPSRSQLGQQMNITTRTLWTYREKYPDIFHDMDIEAIKLYVSRNMNKDGYRVESTLRTLLRTYKPYFKDLDLVKETDNEVLAQIEDPLKKALLKIGMSVGMKFNFKGS